MTTPETIEDSISQILSEIRELRGRIDELERDRAANHDPNSERTSTSYLVSFLYIMLVVELEPDGPGAGSLALGCSVLVRGGV